MRSLSAKEMVWTVVGMERIVRESVFEGAGNWEGMAVTADEEYMTGRVALLRLAIDCDVAQFLGIVSPYRSIQAGFPRLQQNVVGLKTPHLPAAGAPVVPARKRRSRKA